MSLEVISQPLLQEDGTSHALWIAEAGGKTLVSLLERIFSRGSFRTLAPAGLSYDRLKDLRSGGLIPSSPVGSHSGFAVTKTNNTAKFAAQLIESALDSKRSHTIYIREPYLEIGDSPLSEALTVIGDGLFRIISEKECNAEQLSVEMAKYSVPWNFLMIISCVESSERSMEKIVEHAEWLVVNAYDGESYIYWSRDSRH